MRNVAVRHWDAFASMGIEDMLADLGCTSITVAGNLERALGLIESQVFDLATLDINLNGTRSYPAAKALTNADVSFIFATGFGEHGVSEGYGRRTVLTKPFNRYQLVEALTALLGDGPPPALAA